MISLPIGGMILAGLIAAAGVWKHRAAPGVGGALLFLASAFWAGNAAAIYAGLLAVICLIIWFGAVGNEGGHMGTSDDSYHQHMYW